MVIEVLSLVPNCHTWMQGETVSHSIRKALESDEMIVLSFTGVNDVPSSFVNAAFVSLLDFYSLNYIKAHLRISNSTKQINEMVKHRLEFEARKRNVTA